MNRFMGMPSVGQSRPKDYCCRIIDWVNDARAMHWLVHTSWVLLITPPIGAQASRISAPSADYLFQITHGWGASSALESLIARKMRRDDVELRVWGGYGLTGTDGVLLRRTAGRWRAWRVDVVQCTYDVPIRVADSASAATDSLFLRRAKEFCAGSLDSTADGARMYEVDTLVIAEVSAANAHRVWQRVIEAGVRRLPPRIPRQWVMMDGFTYVIELREGDVYRASVIEAIEKSEVEADRQARLIYEAVEAGVPHRTPPQR